MSFSLKTIINNINNARGKGRTIVLATGIFDLLHQEHLNFLKKAKAIGDLLLVGIESDFRVTQIKGPGRPVNPQTKRARSLTALPFVDHVFILPKNFSTPKDHDHLIGLIKPHILAISSHSPHQQAKRAILKKHGGTVKIVHHHNPRVSTTQMINAPTSHEA